MKKYLFTLVFIACFFIENQVYADYFVPPPYAVPYTVNGHTYDQIIQQIWTYDLVNDHMRQQVHYCNSSYFTIAKPILSALDNSHNAFSLWLFTMNRSNMYNSDTDAFDYDLVMGNSLNDNQEFCIFYYTADGGVTWTETLDCLECMPPSTDPYGEFPYTAYIRSTFDLYWSSQPFTPSNSYYNNQFQDGLRRKTGRLIIPTSSFGQATATPLGFPFAGYTAYTAPVSSVMDQSTLGQGIPYAKNGIILAFDGEKGDVNVKDSCWCYTTNLACNSNNYRNCSTVGFKKLDGKPFFEDAVGKKLITYPFDLSKPNGSNDSFLFYDGHPGYDYPAPLNTKIFAPANGILCIASKTKTSKPARANVWRNPTYCPYSTAGGTTWEGYHTFYIIHKGLIINGSANDYMTVFLHNNALDSAIQTKIAQSGYVNVTKGNPIALVGKYSPNKIGPHMHLEVYKKNGTQWNRVDPYGNGTQNILWERK